MLPCFAIVVIPGCWPCIAGFTRELFSILSWVGGGGGLLYFVVKYLAEDATDRDAVHAADDFAQVAIGGVIFLIVLIVVHLITARISDTVLDSRVGVSTASSASCSGWRGLRSGRHPYMFYDSFVCKPDHSLGCAMPVSRPISSRQASGSAMMLQR